MCWSQRLGRGLDFGEPAVRRSSYSLNATLHPGLIADCRDHTNQRQHELTMENVGTDWGIFEPIFFLPWGVRGTVSGRRASFSRWTSVQHQSGVTSMTRRHKSEDHALPRFSSVSLVPWWSRTPPTCSDWNFYFFSQHLSQVVPLYPEVGHVEMDPDALWQGFVTVVKGAVQGTVATLTDRDIKNTKQDVINYSR